MIGQEHRKSALSVFNLELYEDKRFPKDFVVNYIYNEYQSIVNELPDNMYIVPLIVENEVNFLKWEGVIFYPKENVKAVNFALVFNHRYPVEPPEVYLFGEYFKILTDGSNRLKTQNVPMKPEESDYYLLKYTLYVLWQMVTDDQYLYKFYNKHDQQHLLLDEKDDEDHKQDLFRLFADSSKSRTKDDLGDFISKSWSTFYKDVLSKYLDTLPEDFNESDLSDQLVGRSMEFIDLDILLNKQLEEELNLKKDLKK